MRFLPFRLIAALLLLFPALCFAQSPQAAQANESALSLYKDGNFKGAAEAYEAILKNYPTDSSALTATVQLAYSYFYLADYDKAEANLNKTQSGPPIPPELKQNIEGLLPQILAAKAATLPASDPKRKALFEDAIAKYAAYIAKYPNAENLESIVYSKAVAEFQIQKYAEAIADLEANLKKFANSGTIASSRNLLALTLATQGSQELSKGDAADKAKGFALYKRATDLLREIINKKQDLALMNDAYFQMGEILFNQAAFSPEADRPALYEQALAGYRAIAPVEQIVKWQQDQIDALMTKRKEATLARNTTLRDKLQKDIERELRKLEELKSKPDQTSTAILKMGEIAFQQSNYNEARVIIGHIEPFLTPGTEQKRALYFTTMTYALQNNRQKATAGYKDFMQLYKGDPLGDNLPVALGSMELALGNADDAIKYFDESLTLYKSGRFGSLAVVQKAKAEAKLGKFDAALKTFTDYLAQTPPPPKEVAVVAQSGMADIYRDTRKWDDAIAAYKTVKEKYAGTPQAIEADYWVAICTQQKGDNAGAVPLLEAFVKANEKHALTPQALYFKGMAQIADGKKEPGVATLAEVADKYPDSNPAPFTYFTRWQISQKDQNFVESDRLMRQFAERYPKDEKVFYAFDNIAVNSINAEKPNDAIAAYQEYLTKYPESPKAAIGLYKIPLLQRSLAEKIGTNYSALKPEEQAEWKKNTEASIATTEDLLKRFPDSPELALSLGNLLAAQRMLLAAQLKSAADVESYFQKMADTAPTPSAKANVLFTLASYVTEADKARALTIMSQAYKPEIVFSPKDVDSYGLALIDQGKPDEALPVFEKLEKDYPNPPNTPPERAIPIVKEAQADVLFGKGRVAQEKKQTAEAGKYFESLKKLYPDSPKVLEANLGIAESFIQQGKLDEASELLSTIIRAPSATAELRANSMLQHATAFELKWKAETDPKKKEDFLGVAIDTNIKINEYYAGVPLVAAEGLWKGGQLLELQSSLSTDAKKPAQLQRAKDTYKDLLKTYPNSEFAPKAQERLNALGQ